MDIPDDIVKHYVELMWKQRELCNIPRTDINSDELDYIETKCCAMPKGLSDDDKLIYLLLLLNNTEICLVKNELKEAFGWSEYKSGQIAKRNPYCRTVTMFCENGGYGGRGYALDGYMHYAMLIYCEKYYPCAKCSRLEKIEYHKDIIGYCSIDKQCRRYRKNGCVNGRFDQASV